MTRAPSQTFFRVIWEALDGSPAAGDAVSVVGAGNLPSVFRVSDLAVASVSAAAAALAELVGTRHGSRPTAQVDRRLASLWFGTSLRPDGWSSAARVGRHRRRLSHQRWLDQAPHQLAAPPRRGTASPRDSG